MRTITSRIINKNGFTLIEVLVSVVLISLISTMLVNIFMQSATANQSSEKIIDATYIAQSEMERIYSASRTTSYSSREEAFKDTDRSDGPNGRWVMFQKWVDNYEVQMKLHNEEIVDQGNLLVIEVKDRNGNVEAKIQNVVHWEGADAE